MGTAGEDAFEEYYRTWYPSVLAFARRRTEQEADARDVAAEVFAVAWRRFDPTSPPPRAWLFTVGRNLVMNSRRSASRRRDLISRLSDGHIVFARAADTGHSGELLQRAFVQLRPADQELLALAYWEDLTAIEIGLVLGASQTAVNVRLHRARKRLAALLEGAPAEANPAATHHGGSQRHGS